VTENAALNTLLASRALAAPARTGFIANYGKLSLTALVSRQSFMKPADFTDLGDNYTSGSGASDPGAVSLTAEPNMQQSAQNNFYIGKRVLVTGGAGFLGSHPVATTKVSVHEAINMLGLAKRMKCPILKASTSEVYGDPNQHPQSESYWGNVNPIGSPS
jgi:hypothetical protein